MNVMKIIIGSTFALLIACLAISYSSMKKGAINDPDAIEIERLKKREAQLEAALLKASSSNQNFSGTFSTQSPIEQAANRQADITELERVRAELAEFREARNEIEEQAAAVVENAIAGNAPHTDKKAARRANLIKNALVMARITEYNNVEKVAGIKIEQLGNVNTGDTFGIRRNSGIIGRLTIGMIDMDQGIADPIPGSFMGGSIDIQIGDELILPPDM